MKKSQQFYSAIALLSFLASLSVSADMLPNPQMGNQQRNMMQQQVGQQPMQQQSVVQQDDPEVIQKQEEIKEKREEIIIITKDIKDIDRDLRNDDPFENGCDCRASLGLCDAKVFSDLNIEDNIKPVNNLFKLGKYLCDIVYVGKIGGRATSGRQTRDWEPEIEQLRKFYSPDRTVKQMSVLSGIAVGRVYYLLKMKNWEYKKGQRGKRK